MNHLDSKFGEYGGMYVPELLIPALDQLEQAFIDAQADPEFQAEFMGLLKDYAGRPTAMTLTRNLVNNPKVKLYLKREDLLHGGAHKTNQVLGQALLTKRMGKTEIIAETGAGQQGGLGRTAAVRLQHSRRSPLPVPRRPGKCHRRAGRGGARTGHARHAHPWLDEPGRGRRWPAATADRAAR